MHQADWVAPFAGCGRPTFRRGLASLYLTANQIDGTRFHRMQSKEAWGWVDELEVRPLDLAALKRLANQPALGSVNSFDVSFSRLTPAACRAFAKLPWLSTLTRLYVRDCDVRPKGLAALARSPFERLLHLSLGSNSLKD